MGIEATGLAALLPVVMDAAVRGAVVLAAAGLLTVGLRRRSAAVRHLVWAVALAGVLALPGVRAVVPDLAVVPIATEPPDAEPPDVVPLATSGPLGHDPDPMSLTEPARAGENRAGVASGAAESGEWYDVRHSAGQSAPVAAGPAAPTGAASWLAALWLLVAAALLLPVAAGWLGVRRLARQCKPIGASHVRHLATRLALRIGLRREFRLVEGPSRAMPMTWGIARPVILLPPESVRWPESRLEAVLLHELAHVKRMDCLTQLVAEVVRAAHWFNPLVWVAARRLRVERERACDDVALAGGARASRYATELLGLARTYRASRATTLVAVAMARPGQLSDRLLAVLDDDRRRGDVGRRSALRAVVIATAAVLPLAALAPAAAASPEARPGPAAATTPGTTAPVVPLAPIVEASASAAQDPTCAAAPGDWQNVSHQSNDDRSTIHMRRPGCELEVRLDGDVEFDADAVTIRRLGADARLRIEEDDGRRTRYLDVRPGAGGAPMFDYRVNRREAAFDAGAQAWVRTVLLHLFRSAGFAAEERVAAILRRDGVEGVLAELGRIESSFVFARYTRELLEQAQLEEAALRALVRSSGRRVDSDHYMAEILEAVARHQPLRGGMLDDFIAASMALDSDHYRSKTLQTVIRAGGLTNEQVAGVLEAASAMESDHYRTALLTDVADRYALEPGFRHAYLTATAEMESDHYRSQVLERLLGRTDLSPGELADVIAAAAMLDSDHYRSRILARVADRGLGEPTLHRAFFDAAADLDSDHAYRQTMNRLIDQSRLGPDLLVNVLDHARAELDSDHGLSELLLRVLERHDVTGAVRDAFLRAMESIDSDHSRGRVADALLRSGRG